MSSAREALRVDRTLSDQAVEQTLRDHANNPSAFLALNEKTRCFAVPGLAGLIAYREAGRYLVQLGGPFAPTTDYAELLDAFLAYAAGRHRRVLAMQLQGADVAAYAERNFRVNQVGASYALDLDQFSLRGSHFMRLRNKISRAHRSGLVITEGEADDREALDLIDREWLRSKSHKKSLEFLVGERSGRGAPWRRTMVGRIDGQVVGYISYAPAYGEHPGWLHDLSRRGAAAPPGVMEALNAAAIATMRSEGARWLHFGFTPFTGLEPSFEPASASRGVSRVVRFLADHGRHVYPAQSQLAYKHKWGPHQVFPEYVAFLGAPSAGAIWRLLRVTRAI